MKQRFELSRQDKKLMVAAAGISLLALVLFLTLPALVDTKAIQQHMKATFKTATGLDLEIQDGIEVSIFPTPNVVMHNLYVANIPGASSSFMLSVRTLRMKLRPTSLFSSNPQADSINMDGLTVQLERMKNGRLNLREIREYTAKNAVKDAVDTQEKSGDESEENSFSFIDVDAFFNNLTKISDVNVTNAEIHYTDSIQGVVTHYSDINFNYTKDTGDKIAKIVTSLLYGGIPASVNLEIKDLEESYKLKTTSAKLRIESDKTFFAFEGDVSYENTLSIKGKAGFDSPNLTQWIKLLGDSGDGSSKLPPDAKPVPVKLTADVTTEGKNILMDEILVEGGVFSGKLNAVIKPPGAIDLKGTLDSVDMDTIVASGLFAPQKTSKKKKANEEDQDSSTVSLNMLSQKSLWSYVALAVDIRIADISYNKQRIKKGHIEFDMTDGDMAISKISGSLPGESKLLFTGLGKQGYQGFMIDGQLDGSGENFVDMISFFRTSNSPVSLPKDFRRFRFKTNMVLSSQELRFTELSSRVENMAFVGGIITTFDGGVKVQSAIRMGGVDVDRLLQSWSINKFVSSLNNTDMSVIKSDDEFSQWLRSVDYDLDIRISAEQYILNGKNQEKAKFRAAVTKNKIIVTEIDTIYDGTQYSGKALLDVAAKLPLIDLDIALDTIDFTAQASNKNFIFQQNSEGAAAKGSRAWSREGISFSWMDFVNATVKLRIGQIKAGTVEATGLDVRASIEERTLSVPSISANIMGAQFTGKGFIKNGKIPSLSLTGDLVDFDIPYLASFIPALQGMSGRVNSHFKLNTSGIDVYTWLYNMQGSILMATRDTTIDGFNLPGIVNAVGYVRTVADILDAVKRAFPGGSTVFNSMDGEITIGNGVLKFPTSSLKNEMAEGEFQGQIDLINWKMVGNLKLSIFYLDKVTPPQMAVNYRGNLDEIEKELDTRLLERYVANKTSEQLLSPTE